MYFQSPNKYIPTSLREYMLESTNKSIQKYIICNPNRIVSNESCNTVSNFSNNLYILPFVSLLTFFAGYKIGKMSK